MSYLASCLCFPSLLSCPFLLICDSFPGSRRVFYLAFILFYVLYCYFPGFVSGRSHTKNSCYSIIFNAPGRFRFVLCPLITSPSRQPSPISFPSAGQSLFIGPTIHPSSGHFQLPRLNCRSVRLGLSRNSFWASRSQSLTRTFTATYTSLSTLDPGSKPTLSFVLYLPLDCSLNSPFSVMITTG